MPVRKTVASCPKPGPIADMWLPLIRTCFKKGQAYSREVPKLTHTLSTPPVEAAKKWFPLPGSSRHDIQMNLSKITSIQVFFKTMRVAMDSNTTSK
eukprot:802742-Amphidinium_carterae.1